MRVHVVQPVTRPSPGLIQAAPEFAWTVRFSQPHSPVGEKSILACTETK